MWKLVVHAPRKRSILGDYGHDLVLAGAGLVAMFVINLPWIVAVGVAIHFIVKYW